jgi:phenylacetate-CoA ligase
MYSKIVKNILFPIYEIKLSREERYITYIRGLEKTQWWSYPELEKLQLERLKKLLHHANNNVPYYHRLFKKIDFKPEYIQSVNDLNKLPILTKEIVNNNFNDLYVRNYSHNDFILSSTGGSTAAPMKFYIDKKWDACNMAAAYRSWSWAGYDLGDKMAYLWSAPNDVEESKKYMAKLRNYFLKTIWLDAFQLTEENMNKYITLLTKFKPKIINSYSSVIFTFSEYINKIGIENVKPEAILTTSDMLYDYKRKSIEKAFNCDVFDYYSGRDTSLQAAECQEHFGYHLSIENAVVEFMKENEHVSPGETGNLIITDLCNYAMPFIRYDIGDLGSPSDEKCPCGRNLPIMKSLKGRTYDYILTSDGRLLAGIFFHHILVHHEIQGIKEFQIIQLTKEKIIVFIVKNEKENTNDINRFISLIKENVGEKVEVELQHVSSIPRTPTGKLMHVISKLNKTDLMIGKYDSGH